MKKSIILGGLVLSLTQNLWAEGFMDDIDTLSQDLEKAKLCQTLQKMGGQSSRCKDIVPMLDGAGGQNGGAAGSSVGVSAQANRARLAAMEDEAPQILSYQRKGNVAEVEVSYLDKISSLRIGDKVGKWKLVGLNDKSATFAAGSVRRSVFFRSGANVS